MKKIFCLMAIFIFTVLIWNPAPANAYSVVYAYDPSVEYPRDPSITSYVFDYHWDTYGVQWDSGSQQASIFIVTGNSNSYPNFLMITSDSGIAGEQVPVALTWEITTSFTKEAVLSPGNVNETNFAGSDYFSAGNDYRIHKDNGSYDVLSVQLSGTPWTDMKEVITLTYYAPVETYAPFYPWVSIPGHFKLTASGIHAYDPTQDFTVYFTGYSLTKLVNVEVAEPATMLLLASGLVGLAGFRRKFKK